MVVVVASSSFFCPIAAAVIATAELEEAAAEEEDEGDPEGLRAGFGGEGEGRTVEPAEADMVIIF